MNEDINWEKEQKKLNRLYDSLKLSLGKNEMSIVQEIVELELELESISNQ